MCVCFSFSRQANRVGFNFDCYFLDYCYGSIFLHVPYVCSLRIVPNLNEKNGLFSSIFLATKHNIDSTTNFQA